MPRTPQNGIEEQLARWAGESITPRDPQSRVELQLARIAGENVVVPAPQSPEEEWLEIIYQQGGGDTPTGTISITTNGTHDVAAYAEADVAVPQPSGSTSITTNGEHNVADYVTANVAVPEDHTDEDGIVDGSISGTYTNARVTSLVAYAFANRASMTGVSFPEVDGSIPNYCFTACSALESVNLPKAKRIGERAFRNCTNLQCASFPQVTTIYSYAFNNCTSLEWISFDDVTAVPTLSDSNAFSGCSSLTAIYFPDSLSDAAKTMTNWSSYASIIKPLSQKPSA